jgi:hypothetical protein
MGRVIKRFVPEVCLPILPTMARDDAIFMIYAIISSFCMRISPVHPYSCAFSMLKTRTHGTHTHDAIHTLALCRRCRTACEAETCSYGPACTADGFFPVGVCTESSYQQDGGERATYISCEREHAYNVVYASSTCMHRCYAWVVPWYILPLFGSCLPLECLENDGTSVSFLPRLAPPPLMLIIYARTPHHMTTSYARPRSSTDHVSYY